MKNLERKSHTSQNGITLIALIITIIVMLILVGVTINVALNGGLFDKAKDAAKEMEEKTIYEQIVMGMQLDGSKIDIAKTLEEAEKTLTITPDPDKSGINYQVITVQGKNGTYTYTITDEKIVIGEEIPAITNPVAGTYYQPGGLSMTLNEDGTIIGPAEWGLGEGATYTYTDSTITASNGITLEFYELANNNIILMNESNDGLFFSISRNGLEGHEINGTYIDESNGWTLIIDSNEGTYEYPRGSGKFCYYNNKIYSTFRRPMGFC